MAFCATDIAFLRGLGFTERRTLWLLCSVAVALGSRVAWDCLLFRVFPKVLRAAGFEPVASAQWRLAALQAMQRGAGCTAVVSLKHSGAWGPFVGTSPQENHVAASADVNMGRSWQRSCLQMKSSNYTQPVP